MVYRVCKACWTTRSGWRATVIDGEKYRPIRWLSGESDICHFCREHKTGMY